MISKIVVNTCIVFFILKQLQKALVLLLPGASLLRTPKEKVVDRHLRCILVDANATIESIGDKHALLVDLTNGRDDTADDHAARGIGLPFENRDLGQWKSF